MMEISKALNLLKQQLDEIPRLRTLPPDRQQYKEWFGKVCNILELTFGTTSREYDNFARAVRVDYLVYTNEEKREKYNKELDAYETALKSAINKCELLDTEEKPTSIKETKDTSDIALQIFDKMQFHPKVVEASKSLFETGHYAQAIFEAFKAINNHVKDVTGMILDGTNLMEKVFNENKPILKLNELLTPSNKDEQKGFKYIFMGSQIGIRNPKAHENVKQEDPSRTLEYLSIASLLMRRIDESKLVKLNIKE